MKWILSILLSLLGYVTAAQTTITRYQYWFDSDYAAHAGIDIVPPVPHLSFNTGVPTGSLSTGLHMLNSRFQQSDGRYSIVISRPFIKLPSGSGLTRQITACEYWFDQDHAASTTQSLTAAVQFSGTLSLDPASLPAGLHMLHVRFRDNSNIWSSVKSQLFLKTPSTTGSDHPVIDQYEYWFDNNYSGKITQTVSNTAQLELITAVNPSVASPGLHYLHIRFRDTRKIWSSTQSALFMKAPGGGGSTENVITAFRYWIDTLSTPATHVNLASPAKDASIFSTLPLSLLDTGMHRIFFQFRDTAGSWSSVLADSFRQLGVIPPGIVITDFDSMHCAGSVAPLAFSLNDTFITGNVFTAQLSNETGSFVNPLTIGTQTGTQAGVLSVTIPANIPAGAQYNVRILSSAPADTSAPLEYPVTIANIPQQSFVITGDSLACTSDHVYRFNPAQPGIQYTWSLSGGGVLNALADSVTVSWNTAGAHALWLSASNTCGTGYRDTFVIAVSATAPVSAPVITEADHLLHVSVPGGYTGSYQWYAGNIPVPGATDSVYQPLSNGLYTAAFVNACGPGPVSASINVIVPLAQTISFAALPDKIFGDPPFSLNATATSGLPITFAISSGPAILSGNMLTIVGAGTVTITASQQGDATYASAPQVSRSFTVGKAPQTVTFPAPGSVAYGDAPFLIAASATTGLPVSFTVLSGNVSLSGNTITLTGAGSITIRAAQAGNQHYLPAYTDRIICAGAKAPDSILGFANSCPGTQSYSVLPIPGQNYTWALDNGGTLTTFTGPATSVTWNALGDHLLRVTTSVGCRTDTFSASRTIHVANAQPLLPPVSLYPSDSTILSVFPTPFSWAPVAGSSLYDLYIWPANAPVPTLPVTGNIAMIGQLVSTTQVPGFTAGTWYNWKVVARNACSQASAAIQSFKVADLPDLTLFALGAPDTVFSGQNIAVSMVVKNNSSVQTATPWYDNLYLSADSVLDAGDDQLASTYYLTALNTQQSYTRNLSVNLPAMIVGKRYLIAKTNYFGGLPESNATNNTAFRDIYINQVPLPDLKVTSVHTAATTFSGQPITIAWNVKNQGPAHTATGSWTDDVYISADIMFSIANSIKIGERTYSQGILQHDSTYTASVVLSVPSQLFGRYYIHIVTDARQQVYESTFENNNHLNSDSLIIYLTPPPDYVVQNFNTPVIASRSEIINADWTIKNIGAIRLPADSVWFDGLYVAPDSTFDHAILVSSIAPPAVLHPACSTNAPGAGGCRYISPLMDAGDVYYNSGSVTLPPFAADSCYVFLKTDHRDQLFEFNGEHNNLAVKKIRFVRPDLAVTNVQCPGNGFTGSSISVSWSVKNNGPGKLINATRTDRLWLSPTATFNTATAILLADHTYSNSIDSGNIATQQRLVTIPTVAAGTHYIFAEADYGHTVVEVNESNNHSTVPAMIQVSVPDPVDISIPQLELGADTLMAGRNTSVVYQVSNLGTGNILGLSRTDNIYCSRQPVYHPDSVRLLKSISGTTALFAGSTFAVSDSVSVSQAVLHQMGIDSALLYFYVHGDALNTIAESDESNNGSPVDSAYVMGGRSPDLRVAGISGPDSLRSGGLGNIAWTVENTGGNTVDFSTYWFDGLYFSLDTILSANDVFVKEQNVSGPLANGQGYSRSMGFITPNNLSGYYHLLLVADRLNANADADLSNNYKIIKDQNGDPHPVYISLTPPSDLVVSQLEAPSSGFSGQPYQVNWRVRNQGANTTNVSQWQEGVFLSGDQVWDALDIPLATYTRTGSLNAGASYEDSMQLFLPNNAAGNYFLLFTTDKSNAVYEHNNEQNNTASSLIFITQAPPSDLVVTDVAVDTSVMAGDSATVSWVLRNTGNNPASGYLKQGIYCSADQLADNNDVLLADLPFLINLPPADTVHHSARVRVKDVSPGSYHALVRTDLLNNITEQNELNNTTASAGLVTITTPELPLDITRYNVLHNNRELYYRIEIPAALAGQSLLVTLKGDSLQGVNELYLRYDTLPTRIRHDFAYSAAASGNQQVIIPSLKAGTYYLMAYGATAASTAQQAVSLHARVIYFSILDVAANNGGNTGNVTVKISGAKFEQGMKARLSGNGTDITAASVYFVSSTSVFATFNLAGQPAGLYHVKLVKPGTDSVMALNSFTINQGTGGVAGGGGSGGFYCRVTNAGVSQLLGVDVQHPTSTVFNRTFPMTIIFGNSGNVDIPMPTRMLVSSSGHPVALSTAALSEQNADLYLEFREANAPPDVLRPGAVGYITIFTTSNINSNLRFKLIE